MNKGLKSELRVIVTKLEAEIQALDDLLMNARFKDTDEASEVESAVDRMREGMDTLNRLLGAA